MASALAGKSASDMRTTTAWSLSASNVADRILKAAPLPTPHQLSGRCSCRVVPVTLSSAFTSQGDLATVQICRFCSSSQEWDQKLNTQGNSACWGLLGQTLPLRSSRLEESPGCFLASKLHSAWGVKSECGFVKCWVLSRFLFTSIKQRPHRTPKLTSPVGRLVTTITICCLDSTRSPS